MNEPTKRRGRPPKATATKRPNVTIRLTEDLKQRVESDSERSGRSVSEEIAACLERQFQREDQAGGHVVASNLDAIATAFRNGLRQGAQTTSSVPDDASLDVLAKDEWCFRTAMFHVVNALEERLPHRRRSVDEEKHQAEEAIKNLFAGHNARRAAARSEGQGNE
jgi:hypothetical protein